MYKTKRLRSSEALSLLSVFKELHNSPAANEIMKTSAINIIKKSTIYSGLFVIYAKQDFAKTYFDEIFREIEA